MSGLNKYQEYIVEAAFKNAVKGKPNTSTMLSWYEESGDFKQRVDLASIWIDAESIPVEAPEIENGNYYTVTLNGSKVDILQYHEKLPLFRVNGTQASYYNELLKDSIESSFGSGYAVQLYDKYGSQVPFGLNKWVVDCVSGILTFIEGNPDGYTAPYYLTFYKYVGRKGDTGIVTTDGSKTMLYNYTPKEDKSLVTKDYVDTNVTDVSSIVKKLIPNTPGTFEGKDLEILNNHRRGNLVTTTDPSVDVVYVEDQDIHLRVPTFWDENCVGFFAILVNNNEIYRLPIKDFEQPNFKSDYVTINDISESYPDDIVADDFYKSIKLDINLNYVSHLSPYMNSVNYPIVGVKVHWYSNANPVGYYSNEILIGLDNYSELGRIDGTKIRNAKISGKYISGVPAMVAGNEFNLYTSIQTLRKFRKDVHAHVIIDGFLDTDIHTKSRYDQISPYMYVDEKIIVPSGLYQETMTTNIKSFNLDDVKNGERSYKWNIRTDSVSDESTRVSSPDSNGNNYGKDWDEAHQKTSLRTSNELQMLNGKYQWPRGNYTKNGTELGFDDAWGSGPNYETISKDGIRYVTFKFELKNANGFYFQLNDAEGFTFNPNTFVLTNIASIKCIVDSKPEWLDMNSPFDGVLSPFDFEDKGCLVVNRSNAKKRYCTFGTQVLTGNMYVVLGIRYNLDIKLSGISIFVEN